MSFVNPLFFLGTLAAAIPVLLHLIKRERSRKIEFPTLLFLRRVSKKTIRYQKLRHLLLLLLRVLGLALLACAFTRPYRELPVASADAERITRAHVILLDNSLSMDYQDRWERAKSAAAAIVRGAAPGDKVALLEFSDRTEARTPLTTELSSALVEIEKGVELTDRPSRYAQALRVAERIALEGGTGRRTIYLISDFQRNSASGNEGDFRLGSGVELEHADVGSDDFSNLCLGDVRVTGEKENTDGRLQIKLVLINFGNEDRKGVRVSLSLDGRVSDEQTIDSARADVQGLEFSLPGLTPGMHRVILEVDDPRLERDNRFFMTLESRGKTRVMAVEGPASGQGTRSTSFFLSRAVNISSLSRYQLTAVPQQGFDPSEAFAGAILIWNDAPGGSPAQQAKIRDFVSSGGGLAVVLSDNSMATDFNSTFGSWLPVRIVPPARSRDRAVRGGAAAFALLTDIRLDHPIFRPFGEPHSGSFSSARFFRHASLSVAEGGEVLARFDNGDPALVAVSRDKGRVLIYASSADDRANDLPLKAVFAPLWHQMLSYLDNYSEESHALVVGETIAPRKLLVEAALREKKRNIDLNQAIVILDPDKKRLPVPPGGDSVLVEKSGFYEIRHPDLSGGVGVNPVARESDLTHANAEELIAGYLSADAKAIPVLTEEEKLSPVEQDRRRRFWRYLLMAALVLLLGELVLSNQMVLKTD